MGEGFGGPGTPARDTRSAEHALEYYGHSQGESTLIRVPMNEVLPYRVEQTLEPPALTVTFFGAADKTDLIRYDPEDPLVRLVRWQPAFVGRPAN